jgi:hypothetical protein
VGAALPALAAAALAGGALGAAAPRPDFTGVYTSYVEGGGRPGPAPRGSGDLPLTPAARQKVAEYRALVEPTSTNPGAFCLGTGMPGSMLGSGGYPMEIIQRADQITVVYEAHNEIRRIYLGDRVIAPEDRVPERNGMSSARWEGAELVVETDNLKEQVDQRYAHSDQARIVERYRFDKGANGERILVAEMTLTDPVFYTAPVKATKKWKPVPGGHLMTYECDEETWLKHLAELKKQQSAAKTAAKN